MAARIRKDDVVFVRSGDDKGKTGKVLRLVGDDKVVVEGVNVVWKHLKPTQQNQRGGRIQKEAPIHISNVQLWDAKAGAPAKIKRTRVDGKLVRISKKSGEAIK